MTLHLKCGTPFTVAVEGRAPGRTAVRVRCRRLLTKAEEREADELIQHHLFGGRASALEGLSREDDNDRRAAIVRAFLSGATERN